MTVEHDVLRVDSAQRTRSVWKKLKKTSRERAVVMQYTFGVQGFEPLSSVLRRPTARVEQAIRRLISQDYPADSFKRDALVS